MAAKQNRWSLRGGTNSDNALTQLAYKPRDTPLLQQLRSLAAKGWIAVEGIEVLPVQAFAQFELWTGRGAPRRVMREAMLKAYAQFEDNQVH